MKISATQVNRIFRSYQSQSRIAELNKKANIKTVQRQVDRVEISPQARTMAVLKLISKSAPPAEATKPTAETVPAEETVEETE